MIHPNNPRRYQKKNMSISVHGYSHTSKSEVDLISRCSICSICFFWWPLFATTRWLQLQIPHFLTSIERCKFHWGLSKRHRAKGLSKLVPSKMGWINPLHLCPFRRNSHDWLQTKGLWEWLVRVCHLSMSNIDNLLELAQKSDAHSMCTCCFLQINRLPSVALNLS